MIWVLVYYSAQKSTWPTVGTCWVFLFFSFILKLRNYYLQCQWLVRVGLSVQGDCLYPILAICAMIVCLYTERLKFLHLRAYSKKFSQMMITGIWGWTKTALHLTLKQNIGWWFEKQERGRNEIQFSALVVACLEKCWTMERITGVRRSFLWGVVFWDRRRVLVQAAVAKKQRLGSQNIRHLFLMGFRPGILRLQYWHRPSLLLLGG